jgi:hypothetical protein
VNVKSFDFQQSFVLLLPDVEKERGRGGREREREREREVEFMTVWPGD